MRCLVIHPGPNFSVADVFKGWVLGLQANGIETGAYNLDSRLTFFGAAVIEQDDGTYKSPFNGDQAAELAIEGLFSELYKHHPVDVALIVSGFYVPPRVLKMLRDRGTKVVLLHTESPYEDDTQIARSEHADLVLINDPTNLDKFREVNPNTHYQWHCFEPRLHYPGKTEIAYQSQFAFVGTGFHSRINFLEQVNWAGIDAAIAGHWLELDQKSPLRKFLAHDINKCCDNLETVKLYQGTQMSANIYRKESEREGLEIGWAMGPREVELAAIGVPFLRDPRPEGDKVLPFMPRFTEPKEFETLLRWHLEHPTILANLSLQALEAIQHRTFTHSAARMLRLLNL